MSNVTGLFYNNNKNVRKNIKAQCEKVGFFLSLVLIFASKMYYASTQKKIHNFFEEV